MNARRAAARAAWLLALALAGCSVVPASRTETYRCAGGREFALVLDARQGPRLQLAGMSFPVHAEAGREGVYACEVLTVGRDGRTAWLDMQGRPELRDCVRVP
ncbi:hypothetical protein [Ramlibacter sp. AN1133]|uniref:hypothetical protein n=1 Tax=Ramlibacter sp. AN1133 TaxID=3133429 RepID=UPI0030BC9E66